MVIKNLIVYYGLYIGRVGRYVHETGCFNVLIIHSEKIFIFSLIQILIKHG